MKKQGVSVLTPEPGFFDVLKDLPAKFEAEGLWSKGLYQKTLRTIVRKALDLCADALPDYLPETVRQRAAARRP